MISPENLITYYIFVGNLGPHSRFSKCPNIFIIAIWLVFHCSREPLFFFSCSSSIWQRFHQIDSSPVVNIFCLYCWLFIHSTGLKSFPLTLWGKYLSTTAESCSKSKPIIETMWAQCHCGSRQKQTTNFTLKFSLRICHMLILIWLAESSQSDLEWLTFEKVTESPVCLAAAQSASWAPKKMLLHWGNSAPGTVPDIL